MASKQQQKAAAKRAATEAAKPAQTRMRKRAPGSGGAMKRPVDTAAASRPGQRPTKRALILSLAERPNGASIGELTEATGWQAHSVRAALTGWRQRGHKIVRTKDGAGLGRYQVEAT